MLVDGTFASPYHTRALDYDGVDVAIQSATKYLGGHSDLIAGSTSTRDAECAHRIAKTQKLLGNPLGPLESFLLARGLRTLDVRMQRHGENALRVARALEAHPKVAATYFPGLPSHPDHELAKELYRSGDRGARARGGGGAEREQTFGGMIAFTVAGEPGDGPRSALANARRACEGLRVVQLAVSLGGTESLASHPASMTHAMVPSAARRAAGLHDGLIRLSVGLEDADDVIDDLTRALARCDAPADDDAPLAALALAEAAA